MRPGVLIGLTFAVVLASCSRETGPPPGVRYAAGYLPVPPRQHRRWSSPKTKLPDAFVDATRVLFRQGLADPRGCDYREITVPVGSCWGYTTAVKTHGWVLPAPVGETQRFAVCWDGLVWPVMSVGKEADANADVLAAIQAEEEKRAAWEKEHPGEAYRRWPYPWDVGSPVSHGRLSLVKACLLLRLGEGTLAHEMREVLQDPTQQGANRPSRPGILGRLRAHLAGAPRTPDPDDPYLALAEDWTWTLFDRAVCAHMQGDDALALSTARLLVTVREAVETEAPRRDFPRPRSGDGQDAEQPYIRFLDPLPVLLADQERRTKAPPREHVLAVGLERYPDKPKRIAALIRDLEDVAARQWSQPGGVSLAWDPIVKALIREGDDAVEPLLACLETDDRLTRSVSFWRNFSRHRDLHGVAEAAHAAIVSILRTAQFKPKWSSYQGTGSTAWRKTLARGIRDYWNAHKNLLPCERWYRTLADDDARPEQWLEAAGNIVHREDGGFDRFRGWTGAPAARPDEPPKPAGEPLRNTASPSVAGLMKKRIPQLAAATPRENDYEKSVDRACRMIGCLAEWDVKAALPVLTEWMKPPSGISPAYLADFTLARVRAGDEQALAEYADWLRTRAPGPGQGGGSFFEPLWRHAHHPAVAAAADWLFNDKASSWAARDASVVRNLVDTPVIRVAGFRRHVRSALTDRTPAGTVTLRNEGDVAICNDTGGTTYTGSWRADPLAPPLGTVTEFRISDLYAWKLSPLAGTPRCELYWPEAKRDEADDACARFLTRFAPRFEADDDFGPGVTFPVLDHPASLEDVENARAVFSLAGRGEVRQVPMPAAFPVAARWVTLKDYPYESSTWDLATGKERKEVAYDQSGKVWQAEEVLEDGKWERFYGFVGRYLVTKVPAEEIEFPGPGGTWSPLSRKLDCAVRMSDFAREGMGQAPPRIAIGEPVRVELGLRNRGGLDQTVPGTYLVTDPPALRSGIDLKLAWSAVQVVPTARWWSFSAAEAWPGTDADWTELEPKITARFKTAGTPKTLRPTEEFRALQLDLRDGFDLSRAGTYRVRFTFTAEASGFVEGESYPLVFRVYSPSPGP